MKVKSLTFILFLGLIGLFVNVGNAAVWYVDDAPLGCYSWEIKEETGDFLWAVAMSSTGQYQAAVSGDPFTGITGPIYVSSDYGDTWVAQEDWRLWSSVTISSTGQYQTALEYGGQIHISSDFGNTWAAIDNWQMWTSVAISSTGQYQTAVTDSGSVFISIDYGNSWEIKEETWDFLWAVAMSSTGQYQTTVGWSGSVHISSDFGNTWAAIDNWQMWTSVAISSTGQYQTAVAYEGQIYTSHPRDENGESWSTAFRFLKDALAVVSTGEEIRVAQGTYNPDQDKTHPEGTGSKTSTFQLINEVTIKGGYAGLTNPLNPDERNIVTHQTILSGDLSGNDGNPPNFANYGDNSYHVVTAIGTDNTAILDGFTITGGNATGSSEKAFGGGLFNRGTEAGSPTITNSIFTYNRAYYGGAVHNGPFPGSPPKEQNLRTVLTNCIFDNNTAREGGAINGSFLGITNCVFTYNTADANGRYGYGGAIAGGDGETTNCTFYGNTAVTHGGAVCTGVRSMTITNSIFWGNSDDIVGSPFIHYCDVENPATIGDNRWIRGTGNISINPLFINADEPAGQDGIWKTLDDGLRIFINSPCIDVADDNIAPLTDITNKERIDIPEIGFAVSDMGAYESGHDSDGDGMPDEWEIFYGLNPNNPDDADDDTDDDGLNNLEEYQQGTNPTNSDTDGDDMPDGWEVDNALNPLVNDAGEDADSDGLTNLEEYNNNCDPNDSDTDDDGLSDGDEINTHGTNPINSDTD
ncbi:MAG: hypothetical protein PHW62_02730, partial [Candidatus Ratteibacteria bacterium]|nr:hypothetical protein [Candidatus Ratteibacteria bacterium]